MRTVTVRLIDLNMVTINLGFVGENEHSRIKIDCKKAFDEYPTAIPSLAVKNPNGDKYPVVVTRDGNYVRWDVANSDLVYDGDGEIQLAFTVDSVVAKTYVGKTKIGRSIIPSGTTPTPIANFIEQAETILGEVRDAIPSGGDEGQVLAKKSDSDYDLEWVDQTGGGGTSDYSELTNKPKINNVTLESGNNTLADLGIAAASDIPSVSGKADKVSGATNNNFAALDSNGNLKDSGHKHSDYLTSHQDISGKADKVGSAVNGNFAGLDSNGNLTDSGKKASDFATPSDVNAKYTKPGTGIPSSDMASAVQTSLGKADTAYQMPSGGIPSTDLASGVLTSIIDDTAGDGDTNKVWSADKLSDLNSALQGKYEKPSGGIPSTDLADSYPSMDDSSATGVDLDLSDGSGNVLLRLKNGHVYTKNFNSAKHGAKVITLKPSGGDFSTLSSALASITDANSETNPYEIHVYPGTYDTLEGYTEEQIQSADIGGGYTDNSFVGAKLTDGISLIGIGDPTQIILTATLSTDYSSAVRGNISTLNTQGTCSVKNVTIRAQRLRYCVHDDFGSTKQYTRIVENCIFEGIGTSMSYDPAVTWGAGIASAGIIAYFKNCDFGYAFGYHTRASMTGNSLLIFENCRGLCCRIGDSASENDTAHHTFIFNGCDVNAVKISRSSATTPHVSVFGTGNKDMMCMAPVADNPMVSGLMKTAASSVAIGTLVTVSSGEITANSNGVNAVAASGIDSAIGVLVFRDSLYDYIQTDGYIPASRIGLSSLSVGDYITVDGNMKLTSGGTASNAVGVVKYTDTNDAQILLRRF